MFNCCRCRRVIERGIVCNSCRHDNGCPVCGSAAFFDGACFNIECASNDIKYMQPHAIAKKVEEEVV